MPDNDKPVAGVASTQRLEQLDDLLDDLLDIALATARMLTAGPERYSLDDVLEHFGYTRAQLRAMPD
ncbi:MAG: prevent-host-death family protein [Dehalococcoidia bacterium]